MASISAMHCQYLYPFVPLSTIYSPMGLILNDFVICVVMYCAIELSTRGQSRISLFSYDVS